MVISYIMWGMLSLSSAFLLYVAIKNKSAGRWLGQLGLNFILAALLLYVLDILSTYTHFSLPINGITLSTIGLLGLPGLLLLTTVKLVVLV